MSCIDRPYRGMSDHDLESCFFSEIWNGISVENKLSVMQEVECRMAEKNNRMPREVVLFRPEERKDSSGYWSPNDEKIHINDVLTEHGRVIKYSREDGHIEGEYKFDYPGLEIFSTIVHEGTHAWQTEKSKPENYQHSAFMRQICINGAQSRYAGLCNYQSPEASMELYLMQITELHANETGYRETLELLERHKEHGDYIYMKDHYLTEQYRHSRENVEKRAKAKYGDDIVEHQDKKMLENAIEIEAWEMYVTGEDYIPCRYLSDEENKRVNDKCKQIIKTKLETGGWEQDKQPQRVEQPQRTQTPERASGQQPENGYRRPNSTKRDRSQKASNKDGYQRPSGEQKKNKGRSNAR